MATKKMFRVHVSMKVTFSNNQILQTNINNQNHHNRTSDNAVTRSNDYMRNVSTLNAFHPSLVSFGMKKAELTPFMLACTNKFKAPIEKFKKAEDFNDWASTKLAEMFDFSKYKNEEPIVEKEVHKGLSKWRDYLKEDDFYKSEPSLSMIIFDAVTKDISPDTHNLPPVLHKGVLADTVGALKTRITSNNKENVDFNKLYQNKLRLEYSKDAGDIKVDVKMHGLLPTQWVKIPSKIHDPQNFESNVEKLKALSHKTWCTRSTHAEEYLAKGDFYVYLINAEPKAGIRFSGDKIVEIQGERNNGNIPLNYLDDVKSFVEKNELKGAEGHIERAIDAKKEIAEIKTKFASDFAEKRYENILRHLGYDVDVLDDGMLEIDKYIQPEKFTFEELGLDENELFKKVKRITWDADFGNSQITSLGNLESIGRDADFSNSKITSLDNLKYIGGDAYFNNSKIISLNNLKYIRGNAYFKNSQLTSLDNLESIGGDAHFDGSQILDLSQLKLIGGSAHFYNSQVTQMGNLESIGRHAFFNNSQVTSLGNLKSIGWGAHFENSKVTNLGNLESIGGEAHFDDIKVITGHVNHIRGNVYSANKIVSKSNLPFMEKRSFYSRILTRLFGNKNP